jgi:hypothetical protein
MFERRLGPRIDVHGRVIVELDSFPGQLTLLNISPGGFGLTTTDLISAELPLDFRFGTTDNRWTMTFAARLAHIRPEYREGVRDAYVAGFSFIGAEKPDVAARVEKLMELVAAVQSGMP